MKIANIILTSQNGGAEQVFIDYSAVFKKLGHEVSAIIKTDAPYADEVKKLGITPQKINNHFGYHDVFAVKKLKKILEESDTDAIFAHAGRAIVIARKAIAKIKNKKIFLVAINHSMNVKRSIGADLILSVNKPIFYRTIDAGQPQERSFVIPNAVDLSDEIKDAPKINLPEKNVITIGGIGRLDKAKGFRYGIMALKKLEELTDKKFIYKLAGAGPREPFLREMVKKLGLENKVEFCGWIKNKKEFFDSIDILTFTSERETFGLVVLEAMKYRKPIISTNADGPTEILRPDIDALMIKLDSNDQKVADQFAEKILQLVSEPELASKLQENSFNRLHERFSMKALEAKMKEVVGVIGG